MRKAAVSPRCSLDSRTDTGNTSDRVSQTLGWSGSVQCNRFYRRFILWMYLKLLFQEIRSTIVNGFTFPSIVSVLISVDNLH